MRTDDDQDVVAAWYTREPIRYDRLASVGDEVGRAKVARQLGLDPPARTPVVIDGRPAAMLEVFLEPGSRSDDTLTRFAELLGAHASQASQLVDAEALLRDAGTQLDALLHAVHDAILVFDPDTERILEANAKALAVYGFTRSELLGRSLASLSLREHPVDRVAQTLSSNQTTEFETVQSRADGSPVHLHVRAMPIQFAGQKAILTVNRDLTVERRVRAQLDYESHHDALTGLVNRATFLTDTQRALAGDPGPSTVAVIVVDLDRFKAINHARGHSAGDRLLREVADRLRSAALRATTIARVGADEFALLLDDLPSPEAAMRTASFLARILARPWYLDGEAHPIDASIGLATKRPTHDTAEGLVRDATLAMRRSKALGGRRLTVFAPALHTDVARRHRLEVDLRLAISRGEIEPWFQPIISMTSGELVGAEALARWVHPQGDRISPAIFVPAAEAAGLIGPLHDCILDAVAARVRAWRPLVEGREFAISINLSSMQLADRTLVDGIDAALARHDVTPAEVRIEITESAMLDQPEVGAEILARLRERGFELYLDDFGTGYSSLGYLRRLPISAIKLDRSFIAEIERDPKSLAIVRGVLGLARELELSIVAEGVESKLQEHTLRELGCELAQGYRYAPALPADEFEARFLRR